MQGRDRPNPSPVGRFSAYRWWRVLSFGRFAWRRCPFQPGADRGADGPGAVLYAVQRLQPAELPYGGVQRFVLNGMKGDKTFMYIRQTIPVGGRELSIETGKIAKQADGAVVVTCGETVVLVTAVANREPSSRGFFPLTVDYREYGYASGRIPGAISNAKDAPPNAKLSRPGSLTVRSVRCLPRASTAKPRSSPW